MARYPYIVFIFFLVLAYLERLSSTVCDIFSYYGMSVDCRSWVCKGAFTYYVITEGGEGSLKCLRMIMGQGEGVWSYDDIRKINFFHKMK